MTWSCEATPKLLRHKLSSLSTYNQAIADAQARMSEMVDELDGTCYEPEFGY